MTFPRARLTVAACLFVAWLGYLLLLVVLTRDTIVLSRPQFLISDLWVLAELTTDKDGRPAAKAKIIDIFWFKHPADQNLRDQTITIPNLPETGPQGYTGSGKYILPLRKLEEAGVAMYVVTPVPASPGYVSAFVNVGLMQAGAQPERVARLAVDILGMDADDARTRVNVVKGGGFTMLVRGVPREQAVAFAHAVEDLGTKDAAEVAITPDDVRIYPWTPQTQEQIEQLVAAR
jgi:hypothetical protein